MVPQCALIFSSGKSNLGYARVCTRVCACRWRSMAVAEGVGLDA